MTVEREKWRARLPSRWEEVMVGLMVVFAVLNVVRAEAWVKRREEDSVAVLEEGEARGVGYMYFKGTKKGMMMISYRNRGELRARTDCGIASRERMTPGSAILRRGPMTIISTDNQIGFYNSYRVYLHKKHLKSCITEHPNM